MSDVTPDGPLSDAQLGFMQALWEIGEGTVGDVQEQLAAGGRKLAPTTVATVLKRLEGKGWVSHREGARGFVYRPAVSREHATLRLVDRLTGAFFGGNVPALVSHLIDSSSVSKRDLEQIKRLIEAKEKERDRRGR